MMIHGIKSWSIRARLILIFVGILVPFPLLALGLRVVWQTVDSTYARLVIQIHRPEDLHLALDQLVVPVNHYLITADASEREEFERRLARFHEILQRLETDPLMESDERAQLGVVRDRTDRVAILSRELAAIGDPREDPAVPMKLRELIRVRDSASIAVNQLHELTQRRVNAYLKDSWGAIRRRLLTSVLVLLLSALWGVAAALILSNWLNRSLAVIAQGSRRIADGDLSHRVTLASGREFSNAAAAFNEMAERLHASQARAAMERRRLEVLYDVTGRLAAVHDTDQILSLIVNESTQLLSAQAAGIRLLEGDELVVAARTESAAAIMRRPRLKAGESLSGFVVSTGQPVVVEDLGNDSRYDPVHKRGALELGFHGFIGAPLRTQGRIIGTLNVYTKGRRQFTPDDVSLLSTFADQAAMAINKAHLLRETEAGRQAAHERAEEFSRLNEALQREIAERERSEQALALQKEELARSNAELEQFAYVASHDLQEPLRMITGYTQLLARRYKGKLDADAGEFIAYAVDGASRMQRLINDLLTYSRLGRQSKALTPTDCAAVLALACANLRAVIEETGATVTADPLPTVMADDTQLVQLFQNLIGNALKFRSDRPVTVHVGIKRQDSDWLFAIQDNGIGIEPQYAERIFVMFQRLHARSQYPGTGIGLAVCKKIVERHGGRIWVDSEPGQGSTFYFTIPAKDDNHA